MNAAALIALADAGITLAEKLIIAAHAAKRGQATDEELKFLREQTERAVDRAEASIDAALAKQK